ncbi:DUF6503 family protein [Reichenbachiella sp. MALMAid0571]|uniref:DUF6503 family protein n=1 Tax=Reichenbachiella sp. MALMAid0571 TaxID=3143939 RepID=UPI0032DF24F2
MKKVLGVLLVFLVGCSTDKDPQEIIDKAIEVHGGKNFEKAIVSFKFRDKQYSTENYNGESTYTREFDDQSYHIKDILYNSTELTRFINDSIVDLPEEWEQKYIESVNSVLYFFQLPYGLNAPAVRKEYLGECYIFKKPYHKIKVTFAREGGGVDYEDEFIYWIHRDDFTMDFLAYSYSTDGGGTRFRQAINRRKNSGILIQDYVNMKAKSHTLPLEKHDEYFEKGQLEELSRIINEDVKVVY